MTISIGRRRLLKTGVAAAVLSATGVPLRAQRRGGTLRLGLSGAHGTDSWDARALSDTFMKTVAPGAVFDCLTEVAATGELTGELAESWEARAGARVWTFDLRRGVTFHDGAPFGADDVIASIRLHMDDARSPAAAIVAAITGIERLGAHQVRFTLAEGNADFPFLMSDPHLVIYPHGDIPGAMAAGTGTGLYRVESFVPGERALLSRVSGHYKDGTAGWFDHVEAIALNDGAARMAALVAGTVDAVGSVPFGAADPLRAQPGLALVERTGNQHYSFPMLAGLSPRDDATVRQALKYAVDRQAMVSGVLHGHGAIGNDHPIGPANQYHAADLPQTTYDPDRSRALLRQAGLDGLTLALRVSDAAFDGAAEAGALYRMSAAVCGIAIDVVAEPADGYWRRVAGQVPWCAQRWSGRVTEDWMFTSACAAPAAWAGNEAAAARFSAMLLTARADLDSDRRREIYGEMQALCQTDGAVVVPMYANFLDAHSTRIGTPDTIGALGALDSGRLIERWWMA